MIHAENPTGAMFCRAAPGAAIAAANATGSWYEFFMRAKMKLHFLQALRAIAAWLVIVDHSLLEITQNQSGNPLTHIAWTLGSAGVDVFFVISGFIMVLICWDNFGQWAAAGDFLRRRIIRIVPLYWLATVAALAYHRVSATHGAHADWSELLYSLSFIPYADRDGLWSPILPQGWTLSYEMMFYALFAAGLSAPRQIALPAVGAALGAFVIAGPFLSNETAAYLASPIVLWFVLGMGLAVIWHRRGLAEPGWLAVSTRFLEPLGNASYSIYLSHGIVLTMLLRIWIRAAGPPSLWIVPLSLLVATVAGWGVHVLVEKPVLGLTTNLWRSNRVIAGGVKARGAS
jgi:exopolysaccharide production protein ExoZ